MKLGDQSKWVDLDVVQSIDSPIYVDYGINIRFQCAFRSEPDYFYIWTHSSDKVKYDSMLKLYEDFVAAWKSNGNC